MWHQNQQGLVIIAFKNQRWFFFVRGFFKSLAPVPRSLPWLTCTSFQGEPRRCEIITEIFQGKSGKRILTANTRFAKKTRYFTTPDAKPILAPPQQELYNHYGNPRLVRTSFELQLPLELENSFVCWSSYSWTILLGLGIVGLCLVGELKWKGPCTTCICG